MSLLLYLSACFRFGGGVEAGLAGDRPTFVDVSGDVGLLTDDVVATATVEVRGGPAGAEGAVGVTLCKPVGDFVLVDVCGRAYALEFGWRRDHATFGVLSPAAGLAVSVPLMDVGLLPGGSQRPLQTVSLTIGVAAWVGLDVRTVGEDIGPYGSLQVLYGWRFRAANRDRPGLLGPTKARPAEPAGDDG